MVLSRRSPCCWSGVRCEHKKIDRLETQFLADLVNDDVRPILLAVILVFTLDPKRTGASEHAPMDAN